jgi:hypothetical protein
MEIKFKELVEKIKGFGELRFNERHHAWLRHLRIEVECDAQKKSFWSGSVEYILIRFRGVVHRFVSCFWYMDKIPADLFAAVLKDKESLLIYLERQFMEENDLGETPDGTTPVIYDQFLEAKSKSMLNLFLDYQFAQGIPSLTH